ncbi:MAG: DUF3375 domain-containing protein [Candidatus Sericytochromatia bacterium]|nr:DUF3375 domain-containing protein [Candidatus Sericytochromatia bacterium]
MEYEYIKNLKDNNTAIRLLKLENTPLIVSFLFQIFKKENRNSITTVELESRLSDYIYLLNQEGQNYPLSAGVYLQKWSDEGFLRTWYETNNDEPLFELTPATEKTLGWINDLNKKEFVSAESRLKNIFSGLKELAFKTSGDTSKRLEELESEKERIEFEIKMLKAGKLEIFDDTKVRERFMNVEDTARKLLSDFKQIEQNFRELDSEIRKKQISSNISRGQLLDEIFRIQDLIWDTDQGRSFKSFWEFLMSQKKQDELNDLTDSVLALPQIGMMREDSIIGRLKVNLIEAGDRVNKTNSVIIEQLRRYLDDQHLFENKRMMSIIKSIEATAMNVADKHPTKKIFTEIDDKLKIDFIMEKPLFNPPRTIDLRDTVVNDGETSVSTNALYQQMYIDPEELRQRIQEILKNRLQVTLKQVTERYPVNKGLAEVITYFSIAAKNDKAIINEDLKETIVIFNKDTGKYMEVELPQTIFCR